MCVVAYYENYICMYVCAYVHTYVHCVYLCEVIGMCSISMPFYMRMYVHMCLPTCKCRYVRTCTHVCVCVCVCVLVCVCVCVCLCFGMCVDVHSHTCTCMLVICAARTHPDDYRCTHSCIGLSTYVPTSSPIHQYV